MKKLFLLIASAALLASCTSYKHAIYLRNDEALQATLQEGRLPEYHVMR